MILLKLYWEFFKTGLFSVGGGMATLPFLKNIGETTGWYTYADMMNMLAVSESTPGPIGINMATYVGYTVSGVPGAVIATVGEVSPALIVIMLVAVFLKSFRDNIYVDRGFYGLRPASTGLIGAACIGIFLEILTGFDFTKQGLFNIPFLAEDSLLNFPRILLGAVLLAMTNVVPRVKDLHPIVFIAFSAIVGVLFHFAGV